MPAEIDVLIRVHFRKFACVSISLPPQHFQGAPRFHRTIHEAAVPGSPRMLGTQAAG